MKSITIIFDLDHTLIDSSHRQLTDSKGSLNLDHWRENCTQEKIFADTLILPMLDFYTKMMQAKKLFGSDYNFQVLACTARVLGAFDYQYLAINGLRFDEILSRPNGCVYPDHILKECLLRQYARMTNISFQKFARTATMIDDNQNVLNHLKSLGFLTKCAVTHNKVAI